MRVRDVPVDGFWSVSVYSRDGYFEKNDRNVLDGSWEFPQAHPVN